MTTTGKEVIFMKKFGFKKMLSAVMAASIVTGSVSAINALAASPRIYVDIVYEDANTPRADIYFENVPDINFAAFHIDIGKGWEIRMSDIFPDEMMCFVDDSLNGLVPTFFKQKDTAHYENGLFITFAIRPGYDLDMNGRVASVYLNKTNDYSPTTAAINVDLLESDQLTDSANNNYAATSVNPIMLRADEYIIGDANGDHFVDARDCSEILTGINNDGILSVYEIRNSYKDIFKNAEAPAAPDADQNGYIEKADAIETLRYYADTATGTPYEGRIGSINVYETFND